MENAFRRTFMELAKENYKLSVFYADDTSWRGESPTWTSNLQPWEVYLDKANARDLVLYKNILARVDAVFIVTPDFTHSALAQECIRRRVPLILIEKPFDSHCANIESLLHEMGLLHHHGAVLGVDHYMFYAADVQQMMPVIERHLGGAVARVAFYMTEPQPIERERERSLQFGLMLDMLCHMLGMLTWFGAVQTVDDIRVVEAGQYKPLISQDKTGRQYDEIGAWYRRETYVRVQFTYEDHAGNRVPCLGVIGKGCAAEVKYLEVTGVTGNAIRIDLGKAQTTEYPADSIFFLADPTNPPKEARQVVDPYNPTRLLYILPKPQVRLDRDRYKRLIVDLIEGTDHVITNALLLDEAYALVNALDRIWEAIQTAQPQWRPQALGAMRPV